MLSEEFQTRRLALVERAEQLSVDEDHLSTLIREVRITLHKSWKNIHYIDPETPHGKCPICEREAK